MSEQTTADTIRHPASDERARRAAALRGLHVPGDPLVLPNAWDAASARAVAAAGFPAVATGSEAVALALGYEDNEAAPPEEMFAAASRVVRAVDVPVTADLERGYGLAPGALAERLAACGAVGCNLEDSDPRTGAMVDADEQAGFLAEFRRAAPDAVLNARVDVFLRGSGTDEERLAEAVARGRRYVEAGADCVYPIARGLPAEAVRALVDGIGAPVNVLFAPESPLSLADLAAAGVARVSFGPGLFAAVQRHLSTLVEQVRAGHDPYRPHSWAAGAP